MFCFSCNLKEVSKTISCILVKDMADDDMTSAFSYDLEKLQVMKAKTMYEMVEDIPKPCTLNPNPKP